MHYKVIACVRARQGLLRHLRRYVCVCASVENYAIFTVVYHNHGNSAADVGFHRDLRCVYTVAAKRVGKFLTEGVAHATHHYRLAAAFGNGNSLVCALSARIGQKPVSGDGHTAVGDNVRIYG